MSEAEAEIGARVKDFRERIGWPQAGFAYEIGITRDKLASIEYGRTPLRYGVALVLCQKFNISRLWLAKGEGAVQQNWELDAETERRIPHRMLFSQAFVHIIDPEIPPEVRQWLMVWDKPGHVKLVLPPVDIPVGLQNEWYVLRAFKEASSVLHESKRPQFCDDVLGAVGRLYLKNGGSPEAIRRRMAIRGVSDSVDNLMSIAKGDEEADLTQAEVCIKGIGVNAQLPSLLEKIKGATAEPGKKTALARFLSKVLGRNVPLESVSRWLSGEREPGGEIVLQMQAWLKRQS